MTPYGFRLNSRYVDRPVHITTVANVDRSVYNKMVFPEKPSGQFVLSARERILHTAHELFYREGIRATGIDRIIAEARVTKVTFYRHFPSKNDLIRAYLEYRHELWIGWFVDALKRHQARSRPLDALMSALKEWFYSNDYRGCAFINTVAEIDGALPEVAEISRRHKQEMTKVIANLLTTSKHRARDAQAISMAVDGAIVRTQVDGSPVASLKILGTLLHSLRPSAN